jgi:SAM-dependent methyltransferase
MASKYGGPVLELGCGTGRVLLPTARAGIHITGLDLSQSMLDICREKLHREPHAVSDRVNLVQGNMTSFALAEQFRLITIPFRSFQHLVTVEDQLTCLLCIYDHMARGSHLILDIYNPDIRRLSEGTIRQGDEPSFRLPDGSMVVRVFEATVDLARQMLNGHMTYYVAHQDGTRERVVQPFPFRFLYRYEIEHLLTRAGFYVEAVYGEFDQSEFGNNYPGELILVAQKP